MKKIFLTGVYRAGTTLLEKVLNRHPQLNIFSQPFMPLFVNIKRKFLEKNGMERNYPIGPDFMDHGFSELEWNHFLETEIIASKDLDLIFDVIRREKPQFEIEKIRLQIKEGTFIEIFEKLIQLLHSYSLKEDVVFSGSKEILCEEFLPHFIKNDIKSILIIRDPRDIISSLNFGKGKEYTGEVRPLLYSLRLWRKSIAYSIKLKHSPNFIFVRYEDLVSDTENILDRIASFLNLSPQFFIEGQPSWKGNSSFSEYDHISSEPVRRYKKLLDRDTVRYIENVCYPEMKYIGYALENNDLDINQIKGFKEPFSIIRNNFPADFSSSDENLGMEIKRIEVLKSGDRISESDQTSFFLFPEVYNELKNLK